jgi:hypothetical protein
MQRRRDPANPGHGITPSPLPFGVGWSHSLQGAVAVTGDGFQGSGRGLALVRRRHRASTSSSMSSGRPRPADDASALIGRCGPIAQRQSGRGHLQRQLTIFIRPDDPTILRPASMRRSSPILCAQDRSRLLIAVNCIGTAWTSVRRAVLLRCGILIHALSWCMRRHQSVPA